MKGNGVCGDGGGKVGVRGNGWLIPPKIAVPVDTGAMCANL